jgi:hypothetical protein
MPDDTPPPTDSTEMNQSTFARVLEDTIAAVILLSLVGLVAAAVFSVMGANLGAVGATWYTLYALIVVMSSIKLYGKGVYKSAKSFVKGGDSE